MTLSDSRLREILDAAEAIDAAAKHLRETLQSGKKLTPWDATLKATKKKWIALAEGALGAAFGGDITALVTEVMAMRGANQWQPIETAPKGKTPVLLAVPDKDRTGFIVGEAYFDPENYEGGDWWWAGTGWGDYHAGPISEVNHHPPTYWRPLPAPPTLGAQDDSN
jgi:hypothetical protein